MVLLCHKNKNLDLENASLNFSNISAGNLENSSLITGMDGFGGLSKINDIEENEEILAIDKSSAARKSTQNLPMNQISRNSEYYHSKSVGRNNGHINQTQLIEDKGVKITQYLDSNANPASQS